jgi:hypothetical protein
MRNLLTVLAVITALLFTSNAVAQPQVEVTPEPAHTVTQTIQQAEPTATPEPEETTTPQPQQGIESHSYGFHNTGCPEGNSLYQIGTQDFTTIFFETIQPSCALLGIRVEAFVHCPHTTAWVRSTHTATGITTTITQLPLNNQCTSEQPTTPNTSQEQQQQTTTPPTPPNNTTEQSTINKPQ